MMTKSSSSFVAACAMNEALRERFIEAPQLARILCKRTVREAVTTARMKEVVDVRLAGRMEYDDALRAMRLHQQALQQHGK